MPNNYRYALVGCIILALPLLCAAGKPTDKPAGHDMELEDLPVFSAPKVVLHPKDLRYKPTDQLIHPTIVKTAGRIKGALGKYYLYYAPHKHIAISMAYSDSLDGPWTEYKANPVIKGPSAPDIRWIQEKKQFYMWGHLKNGQTELWTSTDGITFSHHSTAVKANAIGTRNATYTRVYRHPLKRFGSTFIMLYSGFHLETKRRSVWLAHSKDAVKWTQIKTPLVEPVKGENDNLYGPAMLRWAGKTYVTYQDQSTWRGGNLKAVEVDEKLTALGTGGKRHILIDPDPGPPMHDRYRGAEFYREGETLYLYSSGSKDPRLIVYAKAKAKPKAQPKKGEVTPK